MILKCTKKKWQELNLKRGNNPNIKIWRGRKRETITDKEWGRGGVGCAKADTAQNRKTRKT